MSNDLERMEKQLSRSANQVGTLQKRVDRLEAMLEGTLIESLYNEKVERQQHEDMLAKTHMNLWHSDEELKISCLSKSAQELANIYLLRTNIEGLLYELLRSHAPKDKDVRTVHNLSQELRSRAQEAKVSGEEIMNEILTGE